MPQYRNLPAVQIENDQVRITVSVQGGHLAEVLHKPTGINPLWSPPWPSIDLSIYSPQEHPEYGNDAESKLLAGIMGHNLCLDMFGPPSPEEERAGMVVHGEAALVNFDIESDGTTLIARAKLPHSQLAFERRIQLKEQTALVSETVENLSGSDRPIAWTQHVTLGTPFIERGITQFRTTAKESRTIEGSDFDWPLLERPDGGKRDLQVYTNAKSSGGYTAHLLDRGKEKAWFFAYSPSSLILFGYVWERADFPWLGIWEENLSRSNPPWNNRTKTLGMEFGVSPFPESRRDMINRHTLFNVPCYRWLPAKSSISIEYYCAIGVASAISETLEDFRRTTSPSLSS